MFTGIVEEVGRVRSLRGGSKDGVLRIAAKRVLGDVRLGDSIAVNGVCLTVTDFDGGSFTADVMPETLRRSNLGMLRAGSPSIWSALWRPTGASGAISYRAISTAWARLPRCARRRTPCGTR